MAEDGVGPPRAPPATPGTPAGVGIDARLGGSAADGTATDATGRGGRGAASLASGFGYDRWARLYPALERLAFGGALQRARRMHMGVLAASLPPDASVLLLAEGNGHALATLRELAPRVRPTVVDGSAEMLARIHRHPTWTRAPGPAPRLLHADLRDWRPDDRYHAVIGCFALDLFAPATLDDLVPRIAASLEPGGAWLHVDFRRPATGWRRRRADVWLALLYTVFGRVTAMEARELAPAAPAFRAAGLRLERRRDLCGGLLESALWRRSATPPGTA